MKRAKARAAIRQELWDLVQSKRGPLMRPKRLYQTQYDRERTSELCGAWQELLDSARDFVRAEYTEDLAPHIDRLERAVKRLESLR